MLTGYLRSKDTSISENTVAKVMKNIYPYHASERHFKAARNLNPKPYHADYFGQKLHVDQNEKLVMYGATHVIARDGYSGMVVAIATMPIKNNFTIYEEIFRMLSQTYGLWDTVRVDGGKEFNLLVFIQQFLSHMRNDTSRLPIHRGRSTDNHVIERIWVEVNSRVNYPLKNILNDMVHKDQINITNEQVKFSVSWISCNVARQGLHMFQESWNHHRIPGKGIPVALSSNKRCSKIAEHSCLPVETAVQLYEQDSSTGRLKRPEIYGDESLHRSKKLQETRNAHFFHYFPSFREIFESVMSGDDRVFRSAVLYHIYLSEVLKLSL